MRLSNETTIHEKMWNIWPNHQISISKIKYIYLALLVASDLTIKEVLLNSIYKKAFTWSIGTSKRLW